jgi:hypothetical protein
VEPAAELQQNKRDKKKGKHVESPRKEKWPGFPNKPIID